MAVVLEELVVKILPNVELAWRGDKPADYYHYFHDDNDECDDND